MSTLHERLLARITTESDGCEDTSAQAIVDALRAVVELHAPFQRSTQSLGCRDCSTLVHTQPGRYITAVPWPCSTITAIASALGVETGETPK